MEIAGKKLKLFNYFFSLKTKMAIPMIIFQLAKIHRRHTQHYKQAAIIA
jgi:hypothetical protein